MYGVFGVSAQFVVRFSVRVRRRSTSENTGEGFTIVLAAVLGNPV